MYCVEVGSRRYLNVALRRGLQSLTDLQSEALTLAYYEDLTQSQIATRLNVPLGTVKARMRDAMKRLGETLGGAA